MFSQGNEHRPDRVSAEEADDYYTKWLNENVIYLISDEEREVFESLTTQEEKDRFIEQFWRRRDTDLATAVNEYREEHYRRIAYANREFGSGIPGWKTDRGRIYIMFGPPDQTEYHSGGSNYVRKPWEGGGTTATYPFEIWRYRNIAGVGDDIELEFVDRSWTGEFKLAIFPWEKDMLLNIDGVGQTTAERLGSAKRNERPGLHPGHLNNTAYMKRYLGQRFKDRPFERLREYFTMQQPPKIKQKELQTIVNTNLSYTVLPFSVAMHHVWIDDALALVPITIEVPNGKLSFFKQLDRFKARVGIYGRVSRMLGGVVTEFEDTVATDYPRRQGPVIHKLTSLYQKMLTLAPGHYKIELVVKDLTSGDLGTVTKSIHLKRLEAARIAAGSIFLARKLEHLEKFPETPKSFVIGDVRVVPSVSRRFEPTDGLGVYLQIYNASLDSTTLLPSVSVEYKISRGNRTIAQIEDQEGTSVEFASDRRLVVMRHLDLGDLDAGHYQLAVKISDLISDQVLTSRADFDVSGGKVQE